MSESRPKYVVIIVAVLMSVTLVGASTAVAIDRTLLDADHVSDTFGEEGVYEELAAQAQENISTEIDENLDAESDQIPSGITLAFDSEAIATEAATEAVFAEEFGRNIEQFIAFLEGETDELDLWIDLTPVYESVTEQFTADAITADTVALAQEADFQAEDTDVEITDEMLARMNEDEAGYRSVRADVRQQGLGDVPVTVNDSGAVRVDTVELAQKSNFESEQLEVTDAMIERLNEGPEGYEAVRLDIRQQVRDGLSARATEAQVDAALRDVNEEMKAGATEQARVEYGEDVSEETLGNIIALQNTVIDGLTDPDLDSFGEYERRRTADEKALESSLEDDIDESLRESNEAVKADATEQAQNEYGEDVSDETLENIVTLQNTVIDGLTDPDLDSFEEYKTRRDRNEDALENSLAADIREQIGEGSEDRIDIGGDIDENSSQIKTAQTGVGVVTISSIALPVVFLVLVGLVYAVTRSGRQTARTTGWVLIVGGLVGAIISLVAERVVLDGMAPAESDAGSVEASFGEAFRGVFESLFGAILTQSVILAIVGIALAGAVYADRKGYFERLRGETAAVDSNGETDDNHE